MWSSCRRTNQEYASASKRAETSKAGELLRLIGPSSIPQRDGPLDVICRMGSEQGTAPPCRVVHALVERGSRAKVVWCVRIPHCRHTPSLRDLATDPAGSHRIRPRSELLSSPSHAAGRVVCRPACTLERTGQRRRRMHGGASAISGRGFERSIPTFCIRGSIAEKVDRPSLCSRPLKRSASAGRLPLPEARGGSRDVAPSRRLATKGEARQVRCRGLVATKSIVIGRGLFTLRSARGRAGPQHRALCLENRSDLALEQPLGVGPRPTQRGESLHACVGRVVVEVR